MRLIKDKYDLTLNEASIIFEREDFKRLRRWGFVPSFLAYKQYQRFSLEFADMFNREIMSQLIDDDLFRLKIINLASNFLPALYFGLMTGDERFKVMFKERYGRDYESIQDLKTILTEIEKLGVKLKSQPTPEQKVTGSKSMKFEEVITYVETILERSIDREMKLYQFQYQYQLAVKRAEELKKQAEKWQK